MKFSIITVCFNSESTLEQTIQSVLNQTFKDIEYLVIDGGSTDGTLAILNKYKEHIKFISEKDAGIYDAMNKGLKMAKGEIIGMIGSDDFYPSNDVLQLVSKAFDKFKTDAIYGDKQFVNPDNIDKVVRYWTVGEYKKENWLKGFMPPHLSFYVKRACYEQFGNYRTDFTCSADYELMLRMLYKNGVSAHYLPKVLMTMRNGGTSTASWKHRWIANQEDRKAWKVNGLQPKWYTLWWKPLSKIVQLFKDK
jgi:glycosyltransferase involved in cell wall biosynthesis